MSDDGMSDDGMSDAGITDKGCCASIETGTELLCA